MSGEASATEHPASDLLALYDRALPHVYGYLYRRCSQAALAEDLTAEVFLAAVDAVRRQPPVPVSGAWLIGVARHKLADHWRRQAREQRHLDAVPDVGPDLSDGWDVQVDSIRARDILATLAPHHRCALVLRYVDDLPVPEVAGMLDRTIHSTEGLLVRARAAFRRAYIAQEARDA